MIRLAKRCSKCVLPATTPSITFDEQGVCNYCKTYKKFGFQGGQKLLKILDSHRSAAKKYECIVNINGGSPYEYTSFKKELLNVAHYENLGATYLKNIKGILKESLKNCPYLTPKYLPVLFKGYLFANQYSIGSRLYSSDIERIDLFHFIRWNEREIISGITEELNWDYPRKLNSTY